MDELEAYKSDGLDVSNIRFDDNSEASRPGLSRYDLQGTEANRLRCDLHLWFGGDDLQRCSNGIVQSAWSKSLFFPALLGEVLKLLTGDGAVLPLAPAARAVRWKSGSWMIAWLVATSKQFSTLCNLWIPIVGNLQSSMKRIIQNPSQQNVIWTCGICVS